MKFADKYPDAEPFEEKMQGIYVVPDYYPCACCGAPTRFLDYMTEQWPFRPVPICSDECAINKSIGYDHPPLRQRSL